MKILSSVFQGGDERIRLKEIDLAEPGSGEALVKIVTCDLCHTDIVISAAAYNGASKQKKDYANNNSQSFSHTTSSHKVTSHHR